MCAGVLILRLTMYANEDLPLANNSCEVTGYLAPGPAQIVKGVFIIIMTFLIISLNILLICVLHSRLHARYLRHQPKWFMTSLACTDLSVGLLVTPISVYPAFYRCWPFGKGLCAIEALMIAALFHESTLSLVCIAVDRYISIVHPLKYHAIMTKKVCHTMIISTWIISFTVYSLMIYPKRYYFFDKDGINNCEPYYQETWIIIVASCLFFFPPVVILSYCYGNIFFVAYKQMKVSNVVVVPSIINEVPSLNGAQNFQSKERVRNFKTAGTLAAIALGFLIAVTPWTLTQLIGSNLGEEAASNIEFIVTWLAISNSFWNPVIYGVMNKSYRDVAFVILRKAVFWKETSVRSFARSTDNNAERVTPESRTNRVT